MLDRLPTELLLHIIDFAAPLSFTREGYQAYAAALTSLCLINHRIRDVAQSMLWRGNRFQDMSSLRSLSKQLAEKGHTVKTQILVISSSRQIFLPSADDLADVHQFVERLSLRWAKVFAICLNAVGILRSLHHLTLLGVVLSSSEPLSSFPSIIELSVDKIRVGGHHFQQLPIDSQHFPSLKRLGWGTRWGSLPFHHVPLELLDQLEALQLNLVDLPGPAFLEHSVPTAFVLDWDGIDRLSSLILPPSLRHLIIGDLYDTTFLADLWASKVEERFKRLEEALPTWTTLHTIFFPLNFHPRDTSVPPLELVSRSRKQAFLDKCRAQGIEVRWRSDANSNYNSSTFCLDFLPLAKELKAKEAIGADAAA